MLDRLGLTLAGGRPSSPARSSSARLAVSFDERTTSSSTRALGTQATQAQGIVEAVLREQGVAASSSGVEHWLDDEDRWDNEPAGETWEEEELREGHAPWEVRVEADSHAAARELADTLEGEGYGVVRRWKYVIVGAASEEGCARTRSSPPRRAPSPAEGRLGSVPGNPFAVFGGMGREHAAPRRFGSTGSELEEAADPLRLRRAGAVGRRRAGASVADHRHRPPRRHPHERRLDREPFAPNER